MMAGPQPGLRGEDVNSDIRLATLFPDCQKLQELEALLGPSKGAGWYLVRLWAWAAVHRPDGDLTGISNKELAQIMRWDGDADVLVNHLIEQRWLDVRREDRNAPRNAERNARRIHDWEEHEPYVAHAEERKKSAKVAADARWRAHREGKANRVAGEQVNAPSNAPRMSPGDAERNAPSPVPDPEEGGVGNSEEPIPPARTRETPTPEQSFSPLGGNGSRRPEPEPDAGPRAAPLGRAARRIAEMESAPDLCSLWGQERTAEPADTDAGFLEQVRRAHEEAREEAERTYRRPEAKHEPRPQTREDFRRMGELTPDEIREGIRTMREDLRARKGEP